MKALSIKQPWASLIAHGIKDIENRTWKTKFRGRIYIHASAKKVTVDFSTEQTAMIYGTELFPDTEHNFAHEKFPVSAIIGEVDIIDCVINHDSIWAEKTFMYEYDEQVEEKPIGKPIYNWVLANPVLYDKPILNVKGNLSLWDWKGCDQMCESCQNIFDMENMKMDGDDNFFCKKCAKELFPLMRKEYEEMVANGEIEPD